eukprot:1181857-Prorocentrum_minimum.AAC.4
MAVSCNRPSLSRSPARSLTQDQVGKRAFEVIRTTSSNGFKHFAHLSFLREVRTPADPPANPWFGLLGLINYGLVFLV